MTVTPFSFTQLTQSPSTSETVPTGFDINMAYLLGQCCNLTYQQYDSSKAPDVSSLALGSNVTLKPSLLQAFTVSEANGPQSTLADPGDYTTQPAGFAVLIEQTGLPSPFPPSFLVIALRGSQTWAEWINDAEAYPDMFASGTLSNWAFVHGGYYSMYVTGTNGTSAQTPLSATTTDRAEGSIAYQIAAYLGANANSFQNLPIYVTGHSLGGALASLCAWDIASILQPSNEGVTMYNLASPRVIMGFDLPSFGSIANYSVATTLPIYQQAVPQSFRIVNTCDIVPVLPPSVLISNTALSIQAAHVTDSYTVDNEQNSGLSQNVVSFCVQGGDIAANHSCSAMYLPYLQWLASTAEPKVKSAS